MTVGDLILKLSGYPNSMEVRVWSENECNTGDVRDIEDLSFKPHSVKQENSKLILIITE